MKAAYHVIAERDKQIEKQLSPRFHLHLHSPAALERVPAADQQRKVVCAQPRVRVWSVGIRVPCRGQDRAALGSGLQALLLERKPL